MEGKDFHKHTELVRAVHRDLVSVGLWEGSLGSAFSELFQERLHADYDLGAIATEKEAMRALELATRLVEAVGKTRPDAFGLAEK